MIYLDVGHGMDNRAIGVFDPGAVHGGFTEAGVVRDVVDEVLRALGPEKAKQAPEGFLPARIRWQATHLGPEDTLVSVHLNAGGGTGVEVFYAGDRLELRSRAMRFSRKLAYRLGLRDRGAKADDMSQHSRLGILRASRASSFLVELGFIDHPDDLQAVHAGGAKALAAIFEEGI